MKEKDSIAAQFEVLMRGKTEVGDASRPLQNQLKELKVRIEEFEGKRAGTAVSCGLLMMHVCGAHEGPSFRKRLRMQ